MRKLSIFLFIICSLIIFNSGAQTIETSIQPDIIDKIKRLLNSHYYVLNALGDPDTPIGEKEIMINETYLKVFKDAEVQLEDDLDSNRAVKLNKDIQAYLKDVDFFFAEVHFNFTILKIHKLQSDDEDKSVFKVDVSRELFGKTIIGDSVKNIKDRFFEINLNNKTSEIKIVSAYEQKISLEEEYGIWWANIDFVWKQLLKKTLAIPENPSEKDWEKIVGLDSLSLHGHPGLTNIEAIVKLRNLKYLDIGGTQVHDLSPIRYCSRLTQLFIDNTPIRDLTPLIYSRNLEKLKIDHLRITNFEFLEQLINLKVLSAKRSRQGLFDHLKTLNNIQSLCLDDTYIPNLNVLPRLEKLEELSIKSSGLESLEGIERFPNLKILDFSDNYILESYYLEDNTGLEIVKANNTYLNELDTFGKLSQLKLLEINSEYINKEIIKVFINKHPKITVVFGSKYLKDWWSKLSINCKKCLREQFSVEQFPKVERLSAMIQSDSLNLKSCTISTDISWIKPFYRVRYLDLSNTDVEDFSIVGDFKHLEKLILKHNTIKNFNFLLRLESLSYLDLEGSKLTSLAHIKGQSIQKININNVQYPPKGLMALIKNSPEVFWIYQTDTLKAWWNNLDSGVQAILKSKIKNLAPSEYVESLHYIEATDSLNFSGTTNLSSFSFLSKFRNLRSLDLSNTNLSDLSVIKNNLQLVDLNISKNPISDLRPISTLVKLEKLNISSTAIDDLEYLSHLTKLKILDIHGTNIKNIGTLEGLNNLEVIKLQNTKVRSLKHLTYLGSLKHVVCYNTKLKSNSIQKFQAERPKVRIEYY